MKHRFLLVPVFVILNAIYAFSQGHDTYTSDTGWSTLRGNWNNILSGPSVIVKSNMQSDTHWTLISADFEFERDSTFKPVAGLVFNAKSSAEYYLLRFFTGEENNTYIQAGIWQHNYFRAFFNEKLGQSLAYGKSYRLSIAPTKNRKEWRPWTIKIIDLSTGTNIFERGIDNWMPLFGQGITGLYAESTKLKVRNFAVVKDKREQLGKLRLAPVFNSGMVLQRNKRNYIWGKAIPTNSVKVKILGKWYSTLADSNGDWKLETEPLSAAESIQIDVLSGENHVVLHDVAVGEVWLASGQSNMQMKVWQADVKYSIPEKEDVGLRMFMQPNWPSEHTLFDAGGQWQKADKTNIDDWSAVAYSFAVELRKKLNVPVGIICSYWGGTGAESWFPRSELQTERATSYILEAYESGLKSLLDRTPYTGSPWFLPGQHHAPGALYNGMISPHVPFSIKGIIWYQGESNAIRSKEYHTLFPMLIRSWRRAWKDEKLPFFYVQLAGYNGGNSGTELNNAWPALREAQLYTLKKLQNVGMVVATDLGEEKNIHPPFKNEIGKRLSKFALHEFYQKGGVGPGGPLFESVVFENGYAVVRFTETANGLKFRGGNKALEFVIAGADQNFVDAEAVIADDGKSIRVFAKQVKTPVAVRYAWQNNPKAANLINSEDLPASPFRTDNWELFKSE